MLIKQIITTTLFLGGTLTARAENLTLQITKGVTVSSAVNYRILVEDFAENQNKYCQDWPEIAFKKKAYLAEACTLKDLTQIYYTRLDGLKNSEESGLEISQILESGPDFRIPALKAGAWELIPFAAQDGNINAAAILVARIGIEKALLAHSKHIYENRPELFSTFANFTIPQMISSFSGYSQASKALSYIKAFQCGSNKANQTEACRQSTIYLANLQTTISQAIGTEDFISFLKNLNEENSTKGSFAASKALDAVQALQDIRNDMTTFEIKAALNGQIKSPAYDKLISTLEEISTSPVSISKDDQQHLLVAISIIDEIKTLQKETNNKFNSTSLNKETVGTKLAKDIQEELYELKSWVTKAIVEAEQVQ